MNYLKRFIPDTQNDALMALLAFIGLIGGAYQAFAAIIPNNTIYLISAVFFFVISLKIGRHFYASHLLGLPKGLGEFNPFEVTVENVWPRANEAAALVALVMGSKHTHVVLAGPSGAGKSILVRVLLPPVLHMQRNAVILEDTYDMPVLRVLRRFIGASNQRGDERTIVHKYEQFVSTYRCSIRDLFDQGLRHNDDFIRGENLWSEIKGYLNTVIPRDCTTVFAFDQFERIAQDLNEKTAAAPSRNGFDMFFLIRLIEYLRKLDHARTLFVVRAEYLYDSYAFLENTSPTIDAPQRMVSLFECPGINSKSDLEAVKHIRSAFANTKLAKETAKASAVIAFEEITGLDNQAFSNTFLTQLCGYVFEHFYDKDPRVKEMLDKRRDRSLCIRYYFEFLLNEYVRRGNSQEALEILKATIFAIAIDNKVTGQSVDHERIAGLAHIPVEYIRSPIHFAVEHHLLRTESRDGGGSYRLAHDMLGDFVIEDERFSFSPRLKEATRALSEARVPTERLMRVTNFANPLLDLFRPNIGLISIWCFYVYGALKVWYGPTCDFIFPLLSHVPFARDCEFVGQFYIMIFFVHVVWVTFIYFLDRGFLSRTLRHPIARELSKMMPVLGSLLGVLFSQAPSLFLAPIIPVGMLMGVLLIWGSWDGSFSGQTAQENAGWGALTFFNMLLTTILMCVTALVIWEDAAASAFRTRLAEVISNFSGDRFHISENGIMVAWMYVATAAMIYFWWHIRAKQQSRLALSARLALCDRASYESVKA